MIHVFSAIITPRIEYTFRLVFETLLNDQVTFYDQPVQYSEAEGGIQLNYSDQTTLPGLCLKPQGLLHESHLQAQYPIMIEWEGEKAFFEVKDSLLPFDLFAATFFLVSRYEEYLPGKRDEHQRYRARDSFAAQHGFLENALVNRWVLKLATILEAAHPEYRFQRTSFSYQPTIDIDNAWAFRHKGFFRTTASLGRDVLHRNWQHLRKRIAVLFRMEKDPYDQYHFLKEIFKQYSLSPIYFFLLHNHGRHDRSLSPRNRNFRKLIRQLATQADVGIHPSYASNKGIRQLRREISLLNSIIGQPVKNSRQHFLKMTLPTTYRNLIAEGIRHDYSMGFPSRPGFRAGIANPFFFFDLLNNEITSLKIHPFQVMDVTLMQYRGLHIQEAKRRIEKLMRETAMAGGTFVSLWHNESLCDTGRWKGWREVYTFMTRLGAELSNEHTTDPQ
jgi:hypothetical protein